MDRRQFIESLSAACLASKLDLVSRVSLINADQSSEVSPASAQEPAALIPIPASIQGVPNGIVSLAGPWLFAPLPPAEFWKPDLDLSKWSPVEIPSEFAMLGFDISPDVEYPCCRTVQIPANFANHRIFVRFDGVYSHARVWVNGVFVRAHSGGFTSWDAEITEHVQAGTTAKIMVGITDRSDDISQGSYYAKHSIRGNDPRRVHVCSTQNSSPRSGGNGFLRSRSWRYHFAEGDVILAAGGRRPTAL